MELRHLVQEYLTNSHLMQVATCMDSIPWVCTVCFAFDEKLHLYWFSEHRRRHSKEIAANPRVAGTIVLSHTIGEPVRGLQFSGEAMELTEPDEIRECLSCNAARYKTSAQKVSHMQAELESGNAAYGAYRITPEMFVLYDTLHFPDVPRQELVLKSARS